MKKKKDYTTEKIAGVPAGLGGIGVTAGLIKGGSVGIVAFGGAIGLPLWVVLGSAGVTIGAIGVGTYYGYKKITKKSKERK